MRINGGFQVSKIKQLGDRIFEKILAKRGIEAFNGAQGRILYVLFQEDGVPIKTVSEKCGLAITSLTTMLERMEKGGLILRRCSNKAARIVLYYFLAGIFACSAELATGLFFEKVYGFVLWDYTWHRFDFMKHTIKNQFMNLDEAYLDRLIEEIYPEIFEKEEVLWENLK